MTTNIFYIFRWFNLIFWFMKKNIHKSPKLDFYTEFAEELDIFDSTLSIPDYHFNSREQLISTIRPVKRKIARFLKELGLRFKILWPIEIDGKWKFADFYFPRQRTVIIVTNPMNDFRPCCLPSDRAEFFNQRYRVLEVENVTELKRKIEKKQRTAD